MKQITAVTRKLERHPSGLIGQLRQGAAQCLIR